MRKETLERLLRYVQKQLRSGKFKHVQTSTDDLPATAVKPSTATLFNMDSYRAIPRDKNVCGTVHCIAGHMAVKLASDQKISYKKAFAKIMHEEDKNYRLYDLFHGGNRIFLERLTPAGAATAIGRYLKGNENPWRNRG